MRLSRRSLMKTGGALLAAPFILGTGAARAQGTVTLKLHHFLPPASNVHQRLLLPWAKTLEEQSKGAIKIDIFPAMQLGGKPPQLYDQAANGVVDIVWTLPGNTPGRFPSTEVFELPFVAAQKAIVNAQACQEYGQTHILKETGDTQLLCFWAHDQGLIHTNKEVKSSDDLVGLKLRNPTRLAGEALAALGATPVGMPIPQVPEALAQRAIDGCVIPWEVVPSIKVNELTKFHTEISGSPTLYTATFFLAMNKSKYDALPADLKAVLDANSSMTFARKAGEMWDSVGAEVRAAIEASGSGTISAIGEDEKAKWVAATKPVHDKWIEDMKAKDIDGQALIDAARGLVQKYTNA